MQLPRRCKLVDELTLIQYILLLIQYIHITLEMQVETIFTSTQ